MQSDEFITDLLDFIESSPTSYHAVERMTSILSARGFRRLDERHRWQLEPGRYFVVREGSLIGFVLDQDPSQGLRMAGAHTDSPGLKIKPNPVRIQDNYLQLTAEIYGSPLLSTWLDRELSLAGRVIRQQDDGTLHCSLVDLRKPVALIPSLAIHLQDKEQKDINRQTALVPILQTWNDSTCPSLSALLSGRDGEQHSSGELLAFDLFCYDCRPPLIAGLDRSFVSGPRLDNLLSCHALVRALSEGTLRGSCLVSWYDHEEVGSGSGSGASSTFLPDVLARIIPEAEERSMAMQRSVFISVDNAHGLHPNYPAAHDSQHRPVLNRGVVIKINANQRYATSGWTSALFRQIARHCEVDVQEFVMPNDKGCGSTIGPLLSRLLGVKTVDVGVPTLGMHSIRELAGLDDCWSLYRCLQHYFQGEVPLP